MRKRQDASPSRNMDDEEESKQRPVVNRDARAGIPLLQRISKIAAVIAAFSACALIAYSNSWSSGARHPLDTTRPPGPKYEIINKAEVVWEVPYQGARGVLFLAHGCSHGAVDFWHRSRGCPLCVGLPEEMSISRQALERGYAVVAVSSADRKGSRCWELPGIGPEEEGSYVDLEQVKQALAVLLPRERLQGLPLYAMGASSGGAFVLFLAAELQPQLAAVCSQIMALPWAVTHKLLERSKAAAGGGGAAAVGYPPTMFVHMPRDEHTSGLVLQAMELLREAGIDSKELKISPSPLTPSYLADAAGPEISPSQSQAIYEAFRTEGLIDSAGMLLHDPRSSNWRAALKTHEVPGLEFMRLKPDLSAVSEELNVLYAQHEIVASTTSDMLTWFEGHRAKRVTAPPVTP